MTVPDRLPAALSSRGALATLLLLAACSGGGVTDPNSPLPPPGGGPANPGVTANLRWSDPATWGGTVPAAGADVTIPAGRQVQLDVSPPALGKLTIEGALVFGDADLDLTATTIHVRPGATLQVGTEARPYTRQARITLTGDLSRETAPFGAKVIGVEGTLDLHGETRTTWLRLNRTATAGATTIELERNPGWRAGERIVLASTDFDPNQAEEAVISAVNGSTLTLAAPLRFNHYGELQTIAGTRLDERGEVALLSRNIVIRSADPVTNGQGGHLMFLSGSTIRVQGVELFQMGQKNLLARYPIHWHLMGDVTGHYVRNVSVWKSFNRCITVHGTNQVVLQGNVCYDHLGHGYFLEDGAERGNTFRENIGLTTRRPAAGEMLLASDQRPSTFWITNPDNTYIGNVAAGSIGIGFWYAMPAAPTGLSTGQVAFPRRTPLRQFDDNVAHSNRDVGINVDHGARPDGTTETFGFTARQNPADGSSPVVESVFRNFVAWKNREAIWSRGSRQTYVGAILADNQIGVTFPSSETFLRDGIIIGESANNGGTPLPTTGFHIGFMFYDGRVGADNMTFANFRPAGSRASGALGIKLNNSFAIDPGNFGSRLCFVDANPVALQTPAAGRDGNKMSVFFDSTGNVTGTAGRMVVANTPIMLTPDCTAQAAWNAFVCPIRYVGLRVDADPSNQTVVPLRITRDDAVAVDLVGIGNDGAASMTGTDAHMNLPVGRRYRLAWPGGTAPSRPRLIFTRAQTGDWIRLEVPYPTGNVLVFRNFNRNAVVTAAASVAEVDASTGDRLFYDSAAGILHLKLQAQNGNSFGNTLFIEPR